MVYKITRLKIGIDIDGVITDFVSTFIEVINEKYNIRFGHEDVKEHDLYKVLGISEDEAKKLIIETLDKDLQPQPYAIDELNKLNREHDIFLITARPHNTRNITEQWLYKHGIKYKELIYLDEGKKHKLKEQSNLKLDVIIDDNLKDIINWIDKVQLIIILNHPWNKSLNIKNNFIRAYNWIHISEILDKHGNSR